MKQLKIKNENRGNYLRRGYTIFSLAILLCFLFIGCSPVNDKDTSPPLSNSQQDYLQVKVLGINDFHGQVLSNDTGGGMYDLARHLISTLDKSTEPAFIVHAGDHVGASPAESALLQDEPSISFLNYMAEYCDKVRVNTCEVMGTAGNHEFDEGTDEMLRLLQGGNHHKGPFIEKTWQGATYTTLSANVRKKSDNSLLLPAYAVHKVNDIDIAFIGLTLDYTPELVIPGAVDGLEFIDQAQVAARYVKELREAGVKAIIIVVHDGTEAQYYSGPTKVGAGIDPQSTFGQFLQKLPIDVDLVVTGHSHEFTNAYIEQKDGSQLLVTQAFSSGGAFADITLNLDTVSKDVVSASASIIKVDKRPSNNISPSASAILMNIKGLVDNATDFAKAYTQTKLNQYAPLVNELALGQFIANSHQYALKTDMAIMNNGGVRAKLNPGIVTWGDVFAIQPFNNQLVVREYSGKQLMLLINQEHYWSSDISIQNGNVNWRDKPINTDKVYTVGGNAYIMNSEGFSVGKQLRLGEQDIDATVNYIKRLPTPFNLSDQLE